MASTNLLLVQLGGHPQVGSERCAAIGQQEREVQGGDGILLEGRRVLRQIQAVGDPVHHAVVLQRR